MAKPSTDDLHSLSTLFLPQYLSSKNDNTVITFNNNAVNFQKLFGTASDKFKSKFDPGAHNQFKVHITYWYWMPKSKLNNTFPPDVNTKHLQLNDSSL